MSTTDHTDGATTDDGIIALPDAMEMPNTSDAGTDAGALAAELERLRAQLEDVEAALAAERRAHQSVARRQARVEAVRAAVAELGDGWRVDEARALGLLSRLRFDADGLAADAAEVVDLVKAPSRPPSSWSGAHPLATRPVSPPVCRVESGPLSIPPTHGCVRKDR